MKLVQHKISGTEIPERFGNRDFWHDAVFLNSNARKFVNSDDLTNHLEGQILYKSFIKIKSHEKPWGTYLPYNCVWVEREFFDTFSFFSNFYDFYFLFPVFYKITVYYKKILKAKKS